MTGNVNTTAPDAFPRIWAALTVDRLMSLLGALDPRPHGRHLTFNCPSCGKPEAYIYEPQDGKGPRLHCNRLNNCGYIQPLWEYIKEAHSNDGKAALAALAEATGVRLDEGAVSRKDARTTQVRTGFTVTTSPAPAPPIIPDGLGGKMAGYQAQLPGSSAEGYLAGRGVDLTTAAKMGFGYCPSWPLEGRARLAYPLTDRQGRLVAIEGRALVDMKPKSLCDGAKGAGVFTPGRLYLDDLHLCEGPLDAAFLSCLGLDAVAVCGANVPDWLLRACAFRHIWTAFDADKAGDDAAKKTADILTGRGATVRRLRPPSEGADWGDYFSKPLPVRKRSLWEAQGIPLAVQTLRIDFSRLLSQIEYLQRHERTASSDRKTLLTRIAADLKIFAGRCDLPDGYTDLMDPFSDEALLILRHSFTVLEQPCKDNQLQDKEGEP